MNEAEMRDTIVRLSTEVYTVDLMMRRLYMALAYLQAEPQQFIDSVLSVILQDIDEFRFAPNYTAEAAAAQRQRMRTRARELFSTIVPEEPGRGYHAGGRTVGRG
jgi:hypothetical protein